ncbi:MAG: transcription antitermination factor NusB [Deltaproteobacteria bacterium]|nr:transcription antitermination factor NusB [Deltaproteobacteria bacterium]
MHLRRRAREAALQALYQMDVADGGAEECFSGVSDRQNLTGAARQYSEALFFGVAGSFKELDGAIEERSENWTVERMAVVDRNVLRIAVYELLHCPGVPYRVVIDEAVELAKRFGSEDSGAFINGILDRIAKDVSPSIIARAQ